MEKILMIVVVMVCALAVGYANTRWRWTSILTTMFLILAAIFLKEKADAMGLFISGMDIIIISLSSGCFLVGVFLARKDKKLLQKT